jgi:serine/threonine-protein kinase
MSDLVIGSTFAGCQLEGIAGRGGMGVVYRATQLTLGRPVAVKAMAGTLAEDTDYRERFQRESQIAASIDHPNVIPVYEAGELDGTLYLIMRWVDGTDLRTLLKAHGRLPPARAVRLLRPVAAALAAAHRSGLVHRDIKPANVLIARAEAEEDEHVYLTDFGIARRTDGEGLTRTGVFVGTIDYAAPERIEGGHGDSAADTYSFGCMLFETLTGHVPYTGGSDVAKMFAHINEPVPSARAEAGDVPEALDGIIAKAMAKDPAERFSSSELVAAMADALHELETAEHAEHRAPDARAAVAPEPAATGILDSAEPTQRVPERTVTAPTARAAPAPERPTPARRRRGPLLLGALALLIAAGVAIALVAGGGGSPAPAPQSTPTATAGHPVSGAVSSISGAGLSQGRALALGGVPARLSVGPGGDMWASLPDSGAIVRIAAAGHKRFAVGGQPSAIAVGPGGVWVAGTSAGPLARFNPQTGKVAAVSQLDHAPKLVSVDPSDSSVWTVESGGAVTRLSPTGSTLGSSATLSPPPVDATAGEPNWLWAVNGGPRGLVRVGSSGSPTTFDTHPGPVSVTLDQGVWTAHGNGHVTRFDPRTGFLNVNTDMPVAPELDAIAAVENAPAVWTISKQTKTLYRLSTAPGAPITGRVTFASAPVALAAMGGGVWVATQDGQAVEILG